MRKGLLESSAVISTVAAVLTYGLNRLVDGPSAHFFESLAQIGATVLVAYAVQTAWVLQVSHKRGAARENWVGMTTGLGVCAFLGIGIALFLSNHLGALGWLEECGFAWAIVSIGFLGLWIALQPWAMYEWTHWFNTEYPDE
jgi:hypothetical protein